MVNLKEKQFMASAVIVTGGKQYRVNPGQVIAVEKIEKEVGSKITFEQVLMVTDGAETHVGTPLITSHTVTGEVVEQMKAPKIRVFTFKSKKRQRRTLGHRQQLTKVKILDITSAKAPKSAAKTTVKLAA
jgi:large subunit ribosomal protein L21